MERLHAAQWIADWFKRLPPDVQSDIAQAYWIVVPALLTVVLWRLMRQESTTESGRVVVQWYSPRTWPIRFMQMRDENIAELPDSWRSFMGKLSHLSSVGYRVSDLVHGLLAGLLGVIMLLMWVLSPTEAWWAGLVALGSFYAARMFLRSAKDNK